MRPDFKDPSCGLGTHKENGMCVADADADPDPDAGAEDSTSEPTTGDPSTGADTGGPPGTTESSLADASSEDSGPAATSGGGCEPLVCGADVQCGVTDDGCGAMLDCGRCEGGTIDEILPVHLIADPARGRLYVTVRSDSPAHPNELVVVDPATAMIVDSAFVGSDPSTMGLSADASTLWVGLGGSLEIRRVDLTTPSPTPGEQYALPPGDWDPAEAGPMAVLPGTTDSVVVSLHNYNYSPSFQGVVVLDAGVPRPDKTPGHTGAARLSGGPDGWAFGFNNLHTGFGFYPLAITDGGVNQTEHEGLIDGFDTDIVYSEGRVYASSGDVVDVSNPAAPAKEGVFPYAGAVLPRPEEARVLMLSPPGFDQSEATLRHLDPTTFTEKAQSPLPAITGWGVHDFVTADGKVLAVIADGEFDEPDRLHVFENPFAG